jgi:hypothetical protein
VHVAAGKLHRLEAQTMSLLDQGYIVLKQITVAIEPDKGGFMNPAIYALDSGGRLWRKPWGENWALAGNPTVEDTPDSTPA